MGTGGDEGGRSGSDGGLPVAGRIRISVYPGPDLGLLASTAWHHLEAADVVLVDADIDSTLGSLFPGAVFLPVASPDDAVATAVEELSEERAVVRLTREDRLTRVLEEEAGPLKARGVLVEVLPAVRSEDRVLADMGLAPDQLGYWPAGGDPLPEVWCLRPAEGPGLLTFLGTRGVNLADPGLLMTPSGHKLAYVAAVSQLPWDEFLDQPRVLLLIGPRARTHSGPAVHTRRPRVLILRPEPDERLARAVDAMGADPVHVPVIAVTAPDWTAADSRLLALQRYQWVVFTSKNGVRAFFDRMRFLGQDVRKLQAKIAVVGQETAVRLHDWCLFPDLVPTHDYSQDGLLESFSKLKLRGQHVLVATGERRRPDLAHGLRTMGAVVDEAVVYRTEPAPVPHWLDRAIADGHIDSVVFSSGSTVNFLWGQLSEEGRKGLGQTHLVTIGALTTRAVGDLGLSVTRQARTASVKGLAEAISETLRDL